MVGLKMLCCAECDYLDKTRKQYNETHYCYRYGCDYRGTDKFICGWLLNDNGLKTMGCSYFKHTETEQLSLF